MKTKCIATKEGGARVPLTIDEAASREKEEQAVAAAKENAAIEHQQRLANRAALLKKLKMNEDEVELLLKPPV